MITIFRRIYFWKEISYLRLLIVIYYLHLNDLNKKLEEKEEEYVSFIFLSERFHS